MRQVLTAGALGRPRGMGWGGRWERGSGWGTCVNPWLIHVIVWQKPLQYCKVISLQLIKINGKRKKILIKIFFFNFVILMHFHCLFLILLWVFDWNLFDWFDFNLWFYERIIEFQSWKPCWTSKGQSSLSLKQSDILWLGHRLCPPILSCLAWQGRF